MFFLCIYNLYLPRLFCCRKINCDYGLYRYFVVVGPSSSLFVVVVVVAPLCAALFFSLKFETRKYDDTDYILLFRLGLAPETPLYSLLEQYSLYSSREIESI